MDASRTLAGLRIESDLPLPGLPAIDAAERSAPSAGGALRIRAVSRDALAREARARPQAMLFDPGYPAAFLVTGPDEILVAAAAGAAERSIFEWLFGPCFAAVAHARGILPLHASAIETAEGCVAFLGRSGSGKSTTVAALARRAYAIHSDDVCWIGRGADERPRSWPSIRRLRLTAQTVIALNYADAPDAAPGAKHSLPLPPLAQPLAARSLRALYVLAASPPAAGASAASAVDRITRLRGARAAERVIANTYRPEMARRLGHWQRVVGDCIALAASTPVFLFERPLDFVHLDAALDAFEAHLGTLAAADVAA
jgi:hypothetical protein